MHKNLRESLQNRKMYETNKPKNAYFPFGNIPLYEEPSFDKYTTL